MVMLIMSNIYAVTLANDQHVKIWISFDCLDSFLVGHQGEVMAVTLQYPVAKLESCSGTWPVGVYLCDVYTCLCKIEA